MTDDIIQRTEAAARYIVRTGATVRQCAKHMGIGKTTLHKDLRVRLKSISPGLCAEVGEILDRNKAERHLRGGEATRLKYRKLKAGDGSRESATQSSVKTPGRGRG